MSPLNVILNVAWFLLGGGIFASLLWGVAGILLFLTVVGIPFGIAAFRIANFTAFPFGRQLVDITELGEEEVFGTTLMNVLWVILAGIWLFIIHLIAAASLCLTIIGIPFGIAHFKLAIASFAPLGKTILSTEEAEKLDNDEYA